jgi:hypothetical protein
MRGLLPFVLAAGLAAAQSPEPEGRVLHVPVRVAPAADGTVALADPQALRVTVAGQPAGANAILGPSDGLMLLIVGDVTEDLMLVETAKTALMAGVRGMPENVWAGLLRAQDGLRVLLDPTADREAFSSAVQALPVSGRAGLLESVQQAAALASTIRAKAGVRVAVLFLTDSDVRNSREDFSNPVINESDRRDMSRRFPDALIRERIAKLETNLESMDAPIFVFHLNYRSDRLNVAYQSGLMQLAAVSGGDSVFCRSQNEIPDALGRMLRSIQSHYSVDVPVPPEAPAQLEVGLECDDCSLIYRTRFRD